MSATFDWNALQPWSAEVAARFAQAGAPFARRLIDDSYEEQPQLQPDALLGGFAGGPKYRECAEATRFYKLCVDVQLPNDGTFLYGGVHRNDRLAAKSASHELKAHRALWQCGGGELRCPLMAVYTYRGKRVACFSMLPIDGQRTLLQGCANGNLSSTRPPPADVDAVVSRVLGGALNIGRGALGIHGPFDMEVHRGRDGYLYVVDPTGLFPPEKASDACSMRWRRLRPELVHRFPRALVSEPYRKGSSQQHRQATCDATVALHDEIAALVRDLNSGLHIEASSQVKPLLHSRGINMRFLPNIAARLLSGTSKALLEQTLKERAAAPQWQPNGSRLVIKWLGGSSTNASAGDT